MISVIIPTYNRAATVGRAIQSALAQRDVDLEVIVVDDGSLDQTKEIVAAFPGVRYVWQSNRRQAAARNHGLQLAKGEFIASLDSDDEWDADFLKTSLDALSCGARDFVCSNHRLSRAGGITTENYFSLLPYMAVSGGDVRRLSLEETRFLFLQHCPAPSSSILMPRELIGDGWDEEAMISDDWFLILNAVLDQKATCVVQPRPLWTKNLGEDNICDGHKDHLGLAHKEIKDCHRLLKVNAEKMTVQEKSWVLQRLVNSMDDAAYFAAKDGRLRSMVALQVKSWIASPSISRLVRLLRLSLVYLHHGPLSVKK